LNPPDLVMHPFILPMDARCQPDVPATGGQTEAHLDSTTKLQAVADERNAAFTRQNAWKRLGRAICPGLVILPRKRSVPAVVVLTRCAHATQADYLMLDKLERRSKLELFPCGGPRNDRGQGASD